jgi:serine/threonine-protein kinase
MDSAPRRLLEIGAVLSETFEIRAFLGEGGMGQVYDGLDLALNRRVAVKVAWPHVTTSIRDEARALAALHDPGTATVYNFGKHDDFVYVVMELINGVSLQARLAGLRASATLMDVDEAVAILARIADGLAAVHRAGIAHRDVKPANIMLAPGDRVVLMDFGIFQPVYEESGARSLAGSPSYMAPELFKDSVLPGELFLVDVYAFGVVAFELLAGQTPFFGNVMRLMNSHLHESVPDLETLRPDAPPHLRALVRELLAKQPEDRPQAMEAVAWRIRNGGRRTMSPPPFPLSVVIADDDEANALVMKALVEAAAPGASVYVAANGREAVTLMSRRKPHLLLLDLQMPRMNGVEVSMYLSELPPSEDACMIVAVSAHAEARDVELLRQLGVAHYVPKGRELSLALPAIIAEARQTQRRGSITPPRSTSASAAPRPTPAHGSRD